METTATTTVIGKIIYNSGVVSAAWFFSYIGIEAEIFFIFGMLLLTDYITAVWKAKALSQKITSNKMKYGIISKMSLVIVPIVLALGAKALKTDASNLLVIGMNILIVSEIYSIIGNIYSIRTRDELPEYDAIAMIGKKLRTILINLSGEKQ